MSTSSALTSLSATPQPEPRSTQTVPDSDPSLPPVTDEEIKPARVTRARKAEVESDAVTEPRGKKVKVEKVQGRGKGKAKAASENGAGGKVKAAKGKGKGKAQEGTDFETPAKRNKVETRAEGLTPAQPPRKKAKKELETPTQPGGSGLDELGEFAVPAGFALEKVVVPPSDVQGPKVWWDRNVRVIKTGNAKKIYKLDAKYLKPLRRTETAGRDGWDLTLYCERDVQQAAWDMRGGRAFFSEYIQNLHNQAVKRAEGKGLPPPPELELDQPPLGECPYYEEGTPDDHVDQTVLSKGGDTHLDKWEGFRSTHYVE